jgi:hypothetical protein
MMKALDGYANICNYHAGILLEMTNAVMVCFYWLYILCEAAVKKGYRLCIMAFACHSCNLNDVIHPSTVVAQNWNGGGNVDW